MAPDPVENCSVINKSSETFHLVCVPGFDGGMRQVLHYISISLHLYISMRQVFHVVVKDRLKEVVAYENSSLDRPDILIDNLAAGSSYIAEVTSVNKKGGSVPKHVLVETLQPPESRHVEDHLSLEEGGPGGPPSWDLVTGVVTAVVLCLALLVSASLVVRRCLCRRRDRDSQATAIVGVGEAVKTSKRKGILKRQQSWDSGTSPDLIPQTGGC